MPTASELWPPACASVTDCSHLPAPEDPVCSLDPALHHTGAHTSSKSPAPAVECWCGGTGEGLGQMNLPLPEAGLPWPGCHPRGSGVLGLHGAKGTSPASIFFFFFSFSLIWILPLAKAEGPAILYPHYLSLSCMSTNHTHLRTKACTVCTPLAWPLTSPGQSGCLRKEGPASCCWC